MSKLKDGWFDCTVENSTYTFHYIVENHVVSVEMDEDDLTNTDLVYVFRKKPDVISNYPNVICTYAFTCGSGSVDVTGKYKDVVAKFSEYKTTRPEATATLKNGPVEQALYDKHFI